MYNYISLNKDFLILLIFLMLSLLLLTGCWGYPYPPNTPTPPILSIYLTGITVQPDTMDLEEGESQSINSVTAYYSDSSMADVPLSNCSYYSYNPTCAIANSNGLITALSAGSTTITVIYIEGTISKTDTIEITIDTPPIQDEIVYRALCVGVGDYINYEGNDDLLAPSYDVDRIRQILQQCRFGPSNIIFSNISYLKDWQAIKLNILQNISSTFSGADSNDISYFYFSGHGALVGNTSYICPADLTSFANSAISVDELESALSAIPGIKVVFLDSCYSGGFIGKSMDETITSKEKLDTFNNEVINVFSQADSKGLLTTNQYKVLTSCHYYQECMELLPVIPGDFDPFGVFTMALCEGCGYYGNYPADSNLDTKVSLQEAYLYVKSYVMQSDIQLPNISIIQDVQVYPNGSNFPIVEY